MTMSDNESVSSTGSGTADPKLGSFEEWRAAILHYADKNFKLEENDVHIENYTETMHDSFLKNAKKLRKILRKTEEDHHCDPVTSASVHLVCTDIARMQKAADGSAWENDKEIQALYDLEILSRFKNEDVVLETDDENQPPKALSHSDVYRVFRELKLQKQFSLLDLVEDKMQKLFSKNQWPLPTDKAYYNITQRDIVFYRYPTILKNGKTLHEVIATLLMEATRELLVAAGTDPFDKKNKAASDSDESDEEPRKPKHKSKRGRSRKRSKKKNKKRPRYSSDSSDADSVSSDDSRSPSPVHRRRKKNHSKHNQQRKHAAKRRAYSDEDSDSEVDKKKTSSGEKDLFGMLTENDSNGDGNRIYWAALIEEEGYDSKLRELWESTNQRHLDEWGTGSDNDPLVKFKMKCGGEFHKRRRSRKGVKYDWSMEEARTSPFTVLTHEYREEMIHCIKTTFKRLKN